MRYAWPGVRHQQTKSGWEPHRPAFVYALLLWRGRYMFFFSYFPHTPPLRDVVSQEFRVVRMWRRVGCSWLWFFIPEFSDVARPSNGLRSRRQL